MFHLQWSPPWRKSVHCVRKNSAKRRCTAPGEVPSPILSLNTLIGFQNTNRGFTKKTQERNAKRLSSFWQGDRRNTQWHNRVSLNHILKSLNVCRDYMTNGLYYCVLVKQQKLELSPFCCRKCPFSRFLKLTGVL